ncbi:pyridoxal-phosphate dependent enzyme [bacterium]|nr:pyridoxal-phosphate dependent enzyme [bacterium]
MKEERPPGPDTGFTLLDGATSAGVDLTDSYGTQHLVAANLERPLVERLAAFEDIFESEVGDTTIARARNVERSSGLRQIFLKFEGSNPSGTQKDRIAFAQALDAMRRGFDAMTVATCGNYGVAIAMAARLSGLRCLVYIPANYSTGREKEMVELGAEIVRVPGDYENAVLVSGERAEKDEIYDANPGGANTLLQLQAYGGIAYEIYDELRDAPVAVAVPASNGTTLAGIHHGFVSLYRRGKTSRVPHLVCGSSHGKNPIVLAWRKNLPECTDLPPERIKETAVNEPLINWHSIDGDLALEAIRTTGGWAGDASDKAMRDCARMLRDREGLNVLPASTAGLLVLLARNHQEPLPGDRYVAILTGRKSA